MKTVSFLSAVCAGVLALAGQQAHAQSINLILTEQNDNTLVLTGTDAANWTYSGSADHWTGVRNTPLPGISFGNQLAYWTEPDSPTEVNSLDIFFNSSLQQLSFSVFSDQPTTTDTSPLADSSVVTFTFYNSDQRPITYNVQFIDLGDTPSVPDYASTAVLMTLGLVPLAWLQRRRAVRQ